MTAFRDPSRPMLLNSRPCWLASQTALPYVNIEPSQARGLWDVRIMCGNAWAKPLTLLLDEVNKLLIDWESDPEGTMRERWGMEPPQSATAPGWGPLATTSEKQVSKSSAEDLGL